MTVSISRLATRSRSSSRVSVPRRPCALSVTAPRLIFPGGFAPPDPPTPSLAGTPPSPRRSGGSLRFARSRDNWRVQLRRCPCGPCEPVALISRIPDPQQYCQAHHGLSRAHVVRDTENDRDEEDPEDGDE